jgi:hypothetical protein
MLAGQVGHSTQCRLSWQLQVAAEPLTRLHYWQELHINIFGRLCSDRVWGASEVPQVCLCCAWGAVCGCEAVRRSQQQLHLGVCVLDEQASYVCMFFWVCCLSC